MLQNSQEASSIKKNRYTEQDSAFSFLIVTLVPIAVSLLLIIIGSAFGVDFIQHVGTKIGQYLVLYCLYLLMVLIYHKKEKIPLSSLSVKPKAGWKNILLVVIATFVCLFASMEFVNFLTDATRTISGATLDTSMPFPLDNWGWLILNLLLVCFLPAVFEEIFYRGILFSGLKRFGATFAVFVSAILFCLGHGSIVQTIYQLILGLVLAIIFLRTGSLLCSILFHFLNNAITVVMSFIITMSGEESLQLGTLADWSTSRIILAFVYFIVGMAVLYLLLRLLHNGDKKRIEWKERIFKKNCQTHIEGASMANEEKQPLKTFSMPAFIIFVVCAGIQLFFWIRSWFI